MTEDSITGDDGSIDEILEDGSASRAQDRSIAADDGSMVADDSSASVFGGQFPEGTGRGGSPSDTENDVDDSYSLGWGIVDDKDDSRLPNRMLVTYEQANSWFDESLFGKSVRDSSPGIIGTVASAAAHIPGLGKSSSSTSVSTDGGEEEYRGPEMTRRGFGQVVAAGVTGAVGINEAIEDDGRLGNGTGDGGAGPLEPPVDDGNITDTPRADTPEPTETSTETETPGDATETPAEVSGKGVYEDPSQAESWDTEQDMLESSPSYDTDLLTYEDEGEFIGAWRKQDVEDYWGENLTDISANDEGWIALDPDRSGDDFTIAWRGTNGNELAVDASDVEAFVEDYMPEETYTN